MVTFLNVVIEVVVVQEDPVVVELAVEAVFDVANGFRNFPDVRLRARVTKVAFMRAPGMVAAGSSWSLGVVGGFTAPAACEAFGSAAAS